MDKKRFPRCTFTIVQEKTICQEYEDGTSCHQLAKRWNSTYSTIYRIMEAYNVKTTKRTYRYDERIFENIDNEATAYFLGYLTADGYIVEGPKRYVVTLTSTDKDIPEAFANYLGCGIPVYEIEPVHNKRDSTEYRVSACSKLMVSDLTRLGVRQRKSLSETFCKKIPQELVHHYMRGIFDGDGTVGVYQYGRSINPGIQMGLVGSRELLADYAKELSAHIGVPLKKPKIKSNGLYKINYGGSVMTRDILQWLYDDCHYYLPRKKKTFDDFVGNHKIREWINFDYGSGGVSLGK